MTKEAAAFCELFGEPTPLALPACPKRAAEKRQAKSKHETSIFSVLRRQQRRQTRCRPNTLYKWNVRNVDEKYFDL